MSVSLLEAGASEERLGNSSGGSNSSIDQREHKILKTSRSFSSQKSPAEYLSNSTSLYVKKLDSKHKRVRSADFNASAIPPMPSQEVKSEEGNSYHTILEDVHTPVNSVSDPVIVSSANSTSSTSPEDASQSTGLSPPDSGESRVRSGSSRGGDGDPVRKKSKNSWNNLFGNFINPSYKTKVAAFKKAFQGHSSVDPKVDRLLTDYSCAVQREILIHGRLFVTQSCICFQAALGIKTKEVIPFKDVRELKKHNVALMFPSAIQVVRLTAPPVVFASIRNRDRALSTINAIFHNFLKDPDYYRDDEAFRREVKKNYLENMGIEDGELPFVMESGGGDLSGDSADAALLPEDDSLRDDVTGAFDTAVGGLREKQRPADEGELSEMDEKTRTLTNNNSEALSRSVRAATPSSAINLDLDGGGSESQLSDEEDDDDDEDMQNEDSVTDITEVACNCAWHGDKDWKEYISNVYYFSVDSLFNLLFENSDFYQRMLSQREAFNFKIVDWTPSEGDDTKRERLITYTIPPKATMGPKYVDTSERQYIDSKECQANKLYIVRITIKNHHRLSDAFVIHINYCLSKYTKYRCRLRMSVNVQFVKTSFLKDIIRGQIDKGMMEHCEALDSALQTKINELKMVNGMTCINAQPRSPGGDPSLSPVSDPQQTATLTREGVITEAPVNFVAGQSIPNGGQFISSSSINATTSYHISRSNMFVLVFFLSSLLLSNISLLYYMSTITDIVLSQSHSTTTSSSSSFYSAPSGGDHPDQHSRVTWTDQSLIRHYSELQLQQHQRLISVIDQSVHLFEAMRENMQQMKQLSSAQVRQHQRFLESLSSIEESGEDGSSVSKSSEYSDRSAL